MVAIPEDRFSSDVAHMIMRILNSICQCEFCFNVMIFHSMIDLDASVYKIRT